MSLSPDEWLNTATESYPALETLKRPPPKREPQRAVLNRANDLNRVRHRHPYGDASMGLSIGEVGQDQRRAGRGIVHGGFDDGMGEFDEPHDTAHGDRSCPARC